MTKGDLPRVYTCNVMKKKPTFSVKFKGSGISPETVPLRTVADTISAIQRLAIGSEIDEDFKADDTIHLVNVKKGSAVFGCFTNIPGAVDGLRRVQASIESQNDLDFLFSPVRQLSKVAKRLKCEIVVELPDKTVIVDFDQDSFDRVSKGMVISGPTTLVGEIKRVGGSTRNHCAVSIPGRRKLLHCKVADAALARQLGKLLYETVVLEGKAKWAGSSFYIVEFRVSKVRKVKQTSAKNMLSALREAGGSDWDSVDDVQGLLSRD